MARRRLDLESTGGLVDDPPHDWTRSTSAAAKALLGPLLAPEALLGAAIFGVAAAVLGVVLRAGHVAVALLGALLWAAGLEAALRLVADGALAGTPVLVAAAAVVVVILEFRRRGTGPAGPQSTRAQISNGHGTSQFRGLKPPHRHTRRPSTGATRLRPESPPGRP